MKDKHREYYSDMKYNGLSARGGIEFKIGFMLEQRKEELKTDTPEKSSTLWK
jgi:hypothetical protein